MNETNSSSSSSNSTDEGIDCYTDDFCWMMEGLGILIIGWIGVFGNSFSMVLFSKQKVHRIFHHLLLLLSVFDLMYVVCSLLVFCLPKFNEEYDMVYRIYMLPVLLPLAHVGLMGSVYCTLALTVERFLAVCYPFLKHQRGYNSKTFVLPTIAVTLLYNLPKFFELRVNKEEMMKSLTCQEILNQTLYQEHHSNCTLILEKGEIGNVSVPDLDEDLNPRYTIEIKASDLRTNYHYISLYLVWLNLITQILVPFVLLIIFNFLTYKKILEFEQALSNQVRVSFTKSRRQTTVRRSNAANSTENGPDNIEMIQLVPNERRQSIVELKENSKSSLLTRFKSIRKANGGSIRASKRVDDADDDEPKAMQATSSIVSGQASSDLRRREVVLAKISIYMVLVLLICHCVKIVPNLYELVLLLTHGSEYHPHTAEWPTWITRVSNVSHFLLTFACSANFYIYFAKHSQRVQRLFKCQRCHGFLRGCSKGNQDLEDTEADDGRQRFSRSNFDSSISNRGNNGRNVSFRV